MRKLSIILTLFSFSLNSYAVHYYVSADGSNLNNGTSPLTPFQTISKVNTLALIGGDIVSFNGGDTFFGSLIITHSGNSGNPITYNSYGTGNAIISGFQTISAWSNLGSNIWESTGAVSTLTDMNMVVINGVNTAMGRYPNTGYFNVDSHVSNTSITSSSLNSAVTNWTGADVVEKNFNFSIVRNLITSASGSTINYNATNTESGNNGFGFFIENDVRTLDVQNEWYYNPSTKKLRIYSTGIPLNVQASTLDTLVYMVGKSDLTFDGIDFTGSNRRAFFIGSCSNVTIQNCNFNFHGLYGIWGLNNFGSASNNFSFNHNTLSNINSEAVVLGSEFYNPYIGNNSIKNEGIFPGMFKVPTYNGVNSLWDGAFGVISFIGIHGIICEYNSIDTAGYSGIRVAYKSDSVIIRFNEVAHACYSLQDNGGIYVEGARDAPYTSIQVYNNICHDAIGNNTGTPDLVNHLAQGIYTDENNRHTQVHDNTCFNNGAYGFLSNSNADCSWINNTSYNNTVGGILFSSEFRINRSPWTAPDPTEMEIRDTSKGNIFFAKTGASFQPQYTMNISNRYSTVDSFFNYCDSNYYARPIDDNITIFLELNAFTLFAHQTLAQWKTFTADKGHDLHVTKSPRSITNTGQLFFYYNPTDHDSTISIINGVDVKNVAYSGTTILHSFTSLILISTGSQSVPIVKELR